MVKKIAGRPAAWGLALVLALAALAAACGSQPSPADEGSGSGWVVLDDDISLDGIVVPGGADEPVAPSQMSLSEAAAVLPFAVALPAWVPPGFALRDRVEVIAPEADAGRGVQLNAPAYASLILTWEDPDGAEVQLQVSTLAADQPSVGAAGLGQTVNVNGLPATLLETQGLGPDRLSLAWARAGLSYRLSAAGGVLAADQLVQMAESIA
jgi:hypothetical protein